VHFFGTQLNALQQLHDIFAVNACQNLLAMLESDTNSFTTLLNAADSQFAFGHNYLPWRDERWRREVSEEEEMKEISRTQSINQS
jgi:hypothetical protein